MHASEHRSWLVVPANDGASLRQAIGSGADAVIVDLAVAMDDDERAEARAAAAEWLGAHRTTIVEHRQHYRWVRINPLEGGSHWREDLLAVMPFAPDGIVLPRAAGPEMVRMLAAELYEIEQGFHVPANSTMILPVVGESARSALAIPQFVEAGHQRLYGLAWGAPALAEDLRATRMAEGKASWTETFRQVRAQVLLTARACGLAAVDIVRPGCEEGKHLALCARDSFADGFSGVIADQASQVVVIHKAHAAVRQAAQIVPQTEDDSAQQEDGDLAFHPAFVRKKRQMALGGDLVAAPVAAPILRPA